MLISRNSRTFFGLLGIVSTLALSAVSSAGCSTPSGQQFVSPNVVLVNRTHQALSTGTLEWANGTYGSSCAAHANAAWSVRIGGVATMDHNALEVTMHDAACVLTLTALKGADTFLGDPAIAMGGTYKTGASAFAPSAAPLAFYGNAKLSAVTFNANFEIDILVSDNLSDTETGDAGAGQSFVMQTSTVSASAVIAPDYTLSFGALNITTDLAHVVQTATGDDVTATVGSHAGEIYKVSTNQSLGTSFAAIDAEYKLAADDAGIGTPTTMAALIPVSDFGLVTYTLPVVRTVIIAHTEHGVNAYEVIRITFHES